VGNVDDSGDEFEDEESGGALQEERTRAIVSTETASILDGLGKGPLDVRIKRLASERDDLQDQVCTRKKVIGKKVLHFQRNMVFRFGD